METVAEEALLAELELSEADGEKRPSRDVVTDKGPASPQVDRAPRRGRCRITVTATSELAATQEGKGSRKAGKFVPRPAVPTPSKAEILLKQAEHISVRGNPCISIRHAENRQPVCGHCYTSFNVVSGIFGVMHLTTLTLSRSRQKLMFSLFLITRKHLQVYRARQNKKLSYRKETVRLLHNIEIRILH